MAFHLLDILVDHDAASREDGQDMVEYALLLGMISVAALAIIVLVGPQISDTFQFLVNGLASA